MTFFVDDHVLVSIRLFFLFSPRRRRSGIKMYHSAYPPIACRFVGDACGAGERALSIFDYLVYFPRSRQSESGQSGKTVSNGTNHQTKRKKKNEHQSHICGLIFRQSRFSVPVICLFHVSFLGPSARPSRHSNRNKVFFYFIFICLFIAFQPASIQQRLF